MKTRRYLGIGVLSLAFSLGGRAETYTIDTKERSEPFEGWGVSLCWWANMCGRWDDESVEQLVDWLVAPDGLNYRIFRYNIGGGDDPQNRHCEPHHMGKGKGLRAEMEGFQDGPGEPYRWERDEAQRRIMLMIKKKRPDAIFEAFSNSAPWWMTVSGCVGGNSPATADNVRPNMYETFAHYLVDVCRHYRDAYGLEFRTLEPFNEPVTDFWYANGSQEGCHFSAEEQVKMVKILHPILQQSGLKTVIAASDETNVEQAIRTLRVYHDAAVLPLVGQWNTHTYSGSLEAKDELHRLTKTLGVKLWQSETGNSGEGIHGNLMMAQRLIDDIRTLRPAAWLDWQYVEERNQQWSLVSTDHTWHSYTRHHNYYIRQQFSRFVREGYSFVESGSPHALAALSPDGRELVVVALNTSRETVPHTVGVPALKKIRAFRTSETEDLAPNKAFTYSKKEQTLSFELPPLSIVTFVASTDAKTR